MQTYHGPFKLGVGSFKVTAIARCSDKVDSIPLTAVLIIKARCARPVFTPPPGFLGAPSTRTSPLPGADGAKAQKSDARMAPGRGAAQIALSTRTWDVKPGAKIHYSVYSVKLASEKVKEARHGVEEDGGHGPRREDQKETDETLLFQGFYSGPFSLPPATAGAGGECDEERSYLVRAIAMDASMLPSEQVSGVYTVPSTESRSLHQAAGGHDLAAPATRDRAEAMDNGVSRLETRNRWVASAVFALVFVNMPPDDRWVCFGHQLSDWLHVSGAPPGLVDGPLLQSFDGGAHGGAPRRHHWGNSSCRDFQSRRLCQIYAPSYPKRPVW